MSHYIKVATKFKDAAALVQALTERFPHAKIEQLSAATPIEGYRGALGHPCSIIVRKGRYNDSAEGSTGPIFGDLGFALEADGSYSQHGDNSDEARGTFAGLAQSYARIVTIKQAKLSGFTVAEVKAADGTITLNLSKWS